MTIEEVIYDMLTSAQGVRSQIGTRLYPSQAPESAEFPLAIYQEAENVPSITHDGAGTSDAYTMDIEVWALDYATAKRVARAIRATLHGYRGTRRTLSIQGIFLRTEADQHELPQHAEERGVYGVLMTFGLYYRSTEGVTHGG